MAAPSLNRRHQVGLLLVVAGAGLSLVLDASAKQTTGFVLLGLACTWLLAGLSRRALRLMGSLLLTVGGLSLTIVPLLINWNSFRASVKDYDDAIADLRQTIPTAVFDLPSGSRTKFHPDASSEQGPWEKYAQDRQDDLPVDFFDKPFAEQSAYLSGADKDFAKATLSDQQAYVQYLLQSYTRTVEIPESTQRWERAGETRGEWLYVVVDGNTVTAMTFPAKMTKPEIVRSVQAGELRARPTFSLWHAVKSHQGTSLGGILLAAIGIVGLTWASRPRKLA
jgi:hypothetical protein